MSPLHPRLADLPASLPVFPLAGALLLPRARLPLHIFEPRYLAMVEDCLATPHRLIGMINPAPGPSGEGLAAIGCAGRLTQFAETDDGRYMITLSGVCRFRLKAELEGFQPWRRFEVDWGDFARDLGHAEDDPGLDRPALMELLRRFFNARQLATDWSGLEDAPAETLINALAMLCPFSPEDRQALLEAPDLADRRETLVTLIEFALRGGSNDEVMQ